jgi:hypothetical protein
MMEKLLSDAFHGRTMCEGRSSGFERGKNGTIGDGRWRCGFKRIQSETTVRENMGRTFWWLATEMMEKLLGDADSRRPCAGDEFERVESNDWRGKIMWIQENTTVRENIGKTLWWLATEMMEKLLGDADSRLKKLRIAREVQLRFQQI